MLPSNWLFPEAEVIGTDAASRALGDLLLLCAKTEMEPNISVKPKASKNGTLKPNIFTNPNLCRANSFRSAKPKGLAQLCLHGCLLEPRNPALGHRQYFFFNNSLLVPAVPLPHVSSNGEAELKRLSHRQWLFNYRGSFGSLRCVNPTIIPKAWSLPRTIDSVPSGSGLSCLDLRNAFARARSRVVNVTE